MIRRGHIIGALGGLACWRLGVVHERERQRRGRAEWIRQAGAKLLRDAELLRDAKLSYGGGRQPRVWGS